jgi:biopolymer transport protein ExbD
MTMAMQAAALKEGEPNSEINTTPLIDVMLVLLIMLIVTIPPQRQAVNLDTPRRSDVHAPAPDPIRIAIDYDGSFRWNGSPVDRVELERLLAIEAHRTSQPEIHIEPHRLAAYKYVAAVMASAQRLGVTKMGVVGGTN